MKRIVYRVKPRRANDGQKWAVTWTDCRGAVRLFVRQSDAVAFAVFEANAYWRNLNRPAQVVLHGRDGQFKWERTYGRDPKRRKG
jgi:hypothetical protein